jgi:hypothetical protein
MLERTLLFEVEAPFTGRLAALDLRAVQEAFSDLMDLASIGLQHRGLDSDDVLLERLAMVSDPTGAGAKVTLTEPPLAQDGVWRTEGVSLSAEAAVTALGIRVYRETGSPLPGFQ